MKTTHITLTRLKKSIERNEVQWVSNALEHAQNDVINEAASFAYLNNHFACFEILAQKMCIENSYNLIKLTCEYQDLEYFKILMTLPQQPKTLERMISYAAQEDFFDGFAWGIENFNRHIDGITMMVAALQTGPHYVDAVYKYFADFSVASLNRIEQFRGKINYCSPETSSAIDASSERLRALITQDTLVNTIGATDRQRGRKI